MNSRHGVWRLMAPHVRNALLTGHVCRCFRMFIRGRRCYLDSSCLANSSRCSITREQRSLRMAPILASLSRCVACRFAFKTGVEDIVACVWLVMCYLRKRCWTFALILWQNLYFTFNTTNDIHLVSEGNRQSLRSSSDDILYKRLINTLTYLLTYLPSPYHCVGRRLYNHRKACVPLLERCWTALCRQEWILWCWARLGPFLKMLIVSSCLLSNTVVWFQCHVLQGPQCWLWDRVQATIWVNAFQLSCMLYWSVATM